MILLPINKVLKNFVSKKRDKQSCQSTKSCLWKKRLLKNNQCVLNTLCSQGEKLQNEKCVPCPSGTYQDKNNHRETKCIPQENVFTKFCSL